MQKGFLSFQGGSERRSRDQRQPFRLSRYEGDPGAFELDGRPLMSHSWGAAPVVTTAVRRNNPAMMHACADSSTPLMSGRSREQRGCHACDHRDCEAPATLQERPRSYLRGRAPCSKPRRGGVRRHRAAVRPCAQRGRRRRFEQLRLSPHPAHLAGGVNSNSLQDRTACICRAARNMTHAEVCLGHQTSRGCMCDPSPGPVDMRSADFTSSEGRPRLCRFRSVSAQDVELPDAKPDAA
jgi:hypothetical protein